MNSKILNYILLGFLAVMVVAYVIPTNKMGIAQKASKFTNVEVTNELLVSGASTLTGNVATAGDLTIDDDNSTSTISVGNTGVGKLCLWNGSSFTVTSYGANTTTATTVTSTACN